MTCQFCKEPVQPRSAYHRVTGWEAPPSFDASRRGGSDITQRERTGEVACGRCIDRLRMGIPAGQEALI